MKYAAEIAAQVAAATGSSVKSDAQRASPVSQPFDAKIIEPTSPIQEVLGRLEQSAKDLRSLQKNHRAATLGAIANGSMTAGEAMASVDTVRRLDAVAHHAWRSASQLLEAGHE
jgi:phosphate:Na+ symporter